MGIGYNVPDGSGGPQNGGGWIFRYDFFSNTGAVISQGFLSFPGPGAVAEGDWVTLKISISSGNVVMTATDCGLCYPGAQQVTTQSISFSAEGGTSFVGLNTPANPKGFFTGFMSEKKWVNTDTSNMVREPYFNFGDLGPTLNGGILAGDEFNINTKHTFYSFNSSILSYTANPTTLQTQTGHGQTLQADAYLFLTDTGVNIKTETTHACIINVVNGACLTSTTELTGSDIAVPTFARTDTSPVSVQYFVNGGGGSVKIWTIAATGWEYYQDYGRISKAGTYQIYSITTFSDGARIQSNTVTLTLQ